MWQAKKLQMKIGIANKIIVMRMVKKLLNKTEESSDSNYIADMLTNALTASSMYISRKSLINTLQ